MPLITKPPTPFISLLNPVCYPPPTQIHPFFSHLAPHLKNNSLFLGMQNTAAVANFPPPHTAYGVYSSILGGSGNNDGGFPYTGMFGNGLNGAPIAGGLGGVFVNQLVMQNVAVGPAGYAGIPIGGLYTPVAPGTGYLASPIYIK
jgi:hypothetical protein